MNTCLSKALFKTKFTICEISDWYIHTYIHTWKIESVGKHCATAAKITVIQQETTIMAKTSCRNITATLQKEKMAFTDNIACKDYWAYVVWHLVFHRIQIYFPLPFTLTWRSICFCFHTSAITKADSLAGSNMHYTFTDRGTKLKGTEMFSILQRGKKTTITLQVLFFSVSITFGRFLSQCEKIMKAVK